MLKPIDTQTQETPTDQPDTLTEQMEASIKGKDAPMAEVHPTAPGAIVWFTYPLALIVIILLGIAAIAFFRG